MNNAQVLVENIKNVAKLKNITLKSMLLECGLNVNALNQISDKKGISCFGLKKIADYLEVSVDYLLGRTDNPETQISGSNINGDNSIQNINSNNTADTTNMEMLDEFQKLTFSEKAKVMCLIAEFNEKRNL